MNEVLKRCASYGYGTYSRVVITTCVQNMWEEGMQYDDPEEVIRRLTAEVTYINTYLQMFDKSACRRLICRFIFFFGADFIYIHSICGAFLSCRLTCDEKYEKCLKRTCTRTYTRTYVLVTHTHVNIHAPLHNLFLHFFLSSLIFYLLHFFPPRPLFFSKIYLFFSFFYSLSLPFYV